VAPFHTTLLATPTWRYALGGIIFKHPDYSENEFSVERVVASRAALITSTGRVIE